MSSQPPHRLLVSLVVGNTSDRLPHPTAAGHTHQWTVFVRPPRGEFSDRRFIRSVTFQLHESFAHPRRKVKHPPFQVTETGYGGFTIPIEIQFAGHKKVYTINHELSLSLLGGWVAYLSRAYLSDDHKEFAYEHRLESKNPSEELFRLSQRYCPARKTSSAVSNSSTASTSDASKGAPVNGQARSVSHLFMSPESEGTSGREAADKSESKRLCKHKIRKAKKEAKQRERELQREEAPTVDPLTQELLALKGRLESLEDPELVFRCADYLVENEAGAVTMDDQWMDFDLKGISARTRERLGEMLGEGK